MSAEAQRPRPAITADTAPWWKGLTEGKLLVQYCTACSYRQHPPEPACMACGSFDLTWLEASGEGEIWSYVVYHEPEVPGLDLPYVVAVATLAEGTRLIASLVDCVPDEVRIGMPVTVDFLTVDDTFSCAVLRLASDGAAQTSTATVGAR